MSQYHEFRWAREPVTSQQDAVKGAKGELLQGRTARPCSYDFKAAIFARKVAAKGWRKNYAFVHFYGESGPTGGRQRRRGSRPLGRMAVRRGAGARPASSRRADHATAPASAVPEAPRASSRSVAMRRGGTQRVHEEGGGSRHTARDRGLSRHEGRPLAVEPPLRLPGIVNSLVFSEEVPLSL